MRCAIRLSPAALGCVCLAFGGSAHAQSPAPVFGTTVVIPSGLRGEIYFLPPNTQALPPFSSLDPAGTIYTSALDVSTRQFTQGFPGVTNRIEWFAIDYRGRFWIDEPGPYSFALTSDDGSRLYIDGRLTIENDGIHPAMRRETTVLLAGGIHRIRVSYFQGPRFEIALSLQVKSPGGTFRVFSTEEFKPPTDPATWKYAAQKEMDVAAPIGESAGAASKHARAAFLAGAAALYDRNLRKAEEELTRAVHLDGDYAPAWSCLGLVWDERAVQERASAAWRKALEADPAYIPAAVHLAALDLAQDNDAEAARITSAAIASGAGPNPLVFYYNAAARAHMGDRDGAERSVRAAIELDMAGEAPRAEYLLGLLLGEKGDRAGAIEHLQRYLTISPNAKDAAEVREQLLKLMTR